ncbi:unnamed protein product, partial [marine sediment metagenome]
NSPFDTFFSPPWDFLTEVLNFFVRQLGFKIDFNLEKRGYYPKGGVRAQVVVYPCKEVKPLKLLERGDFKEIKILSRAGKPLDKRQVAERQVEVVKKALENKFNVPIKEEIEYFETLGAGSSLVILGNFENTVLSSNALGKIKRTAEEVGQLAVKDFIEEIGGKSCLDRYMKDQILTFIALAKEKSEILVGDLTEHAKTNIKIIELFLDGKFKIEKGILSWNENL